MAKAYFEVTGRRLLGEPWEMVEMVQVLSYQHPEMAEFFRHAMSISPAEGLQVEAQFHWMTRWGQMGCPTFEVTHSLAAALVLTECHGVRAEDVRWPFPAFLVSLPPDNPITVNIPGMAARQPAQHILFHAYRQTKTGRQMLSFDRSAPYPKFHQHILDYIQGAPTEAVTRLVARTKQDIAIHRLYSDLTPGMSVDSWVFGTEAKSPDWTDSPLAATFDEKDGRALQMAHRLVANLCVYLDACRDDVCASQGGMPRRGDRRPPPTQHWVVGRAVKLPPKLRDAARLLAESGENKVGWRVRCRFVVRGHWRMQACGHGRHERRRIWIQPFWKGEGFTDQMERTYAAKAAGE